jgi:lipopolysaccharide biosynthesis glycosyltransferase
MTPADPHTILLACAADDRYVQPLAVMLQSVIANLSPDRRVCVYAIDGGIAEEHRRALGTAWDPARAEVLFMSCRQDSLAGLPLWGRMPVVTYYKLLVPELLPADARKVIWLDCDLVVTGDLARLWDAELDGHALLAVHDPGVPTLASRDGVGPRRELGLADDAKYFNAGVMLINLELWRRERVAERALEYLHRFHDRVVFHDQEALNAVLAGRWGELDPRWNRMTNPALPAPHEEPFVYHFTGHLKPWMYPGPHRSHALYYQYLDRTMWAGWRPAPRLFRRVLGRYQASALRRVLLPVEERVMRLLRPFTRSHV